MLHPPHPFEQLLAEVSRDLALGCCGSSSGSCMHYQSCERYLAFVGACELLSVSSNNILVILLAGSLDPWGCSLEPANSETLTK